MFPVLVLRRLSYSLLNSIETRGTCSLFHLENSETEKKKKENVFTLINKTGIHFAWAIITLTARASSVFLSSFIIKLPYNRDGGAHRTS